MSKTEAAKQNYQARRELRLRRDKTAALLMPFFLEQGRTAGLAARAAVQAADLLLAELDRTRRDLAPQPVAADPPNAT